MELTEEQIKAVKAAAESAEKTIAQWREASRIKSPEEKLAASISRLWDAVNQLQKDVQELKAQPATEEGD